MFLSNRDNLEEHIQRNEKKFNEVSIRHERLNEQIAGFLAELQVSPQQLSIYLSDQSNFSEETWNEILKRREQMDHKLQLDLDQIQNPDSMKKKYADRNIGQHWLFVR